MGKAEWPHQPESQLANTDIAVGAKPARMLWHTKI